MRTGVVAPPAAARYDAGGWHGTGTVAISTAEFVDERCN
jgi:hypothetical protein